MKSFPLRLAVISVGIICILTIGAVSALAQDEASVEAVWQDQYQGDMASVRIIFQNNIADEIVIYRISLHFDWMPEDDFYSYDLSGSPRHVQGFGSQLFELTDIELKEGATAGEHSYYVSIDANQNGVNIIWNSPSLTMEVYDGNEKIYKELEPEINSRINNATFTNSQAQSLLKKAKDEYNNALSSANEGEWLEAVSSLQNASVYLNQAEDAELTGGVNVESLLSYLAITVIAVVIAILIVAVVVRRTRKKSDLLEPAEPEE